MQLEINSHAPEEWLERYAMRQLTEVEFESLEDHLMFCHWCQDKLESVDSILFVAREASRRVRQEDLMSQARSPFWSHFPRFLLTNPFGGDRPRSWFAIPITAAAMACLALFLMVSQSQNADFQQVRLESFRGTLANSASSKHPLELILNLDGLPPTPAYRVEFVSAEGSTNISSVAEPQGNVLKVRIESKLRPGQYWVRLYIPGATEPLQEFPLRAD